jgi:hypothetical protein
MSFKKKKFLIVKKALPKVVAHFVSDYFCIKRQVNMTMIKNNYISIFQPDFGTWNDPQIPNTYSHYADIAMETLLLGLLPKMEKESGMKLVPTYSYARIYKKGDVLERHKDRASCEISATLNLGGDKWPIFLEPSGKTNKKGIKVDLNHGDMLMYKGCDLEHWREPFTGEICVQVFLHYNKKNKTDNNEFDGREHIGLPEWFKGRKNVNKTKI